MLKVGRLTSPFRFYFCVNKNPSLRCGVLPVTPGECQQSYKELTLFFSWWSARFYPWGFLLSPLSCRSICSSCSRDVWLILLIHLMCVSKNVCVCGLQRSGINSSDVEVLTLTNVTEEDAGEYICKASNYIGEVSQSGWLTVITGNLWDLTHLHSLPTFRCGFIGFDPDLLCCGGPAGGPLVVLVSQSVFPLYVAPLCNSCSPTPRHYLGMVRPWKHWTSPHTETSKLTQLASFFCASCVKVMHGVAVFSMLALCCACV